jgi:hypothetical protein
MVHHDKALEAEVVDGEKLTRRNISLSARAVRL